MAELEKALEARSGTKCELCSSSDSLAVYHIEPSELASEETSALLCSVCRDQLADPSTLDTNHWYCLSDSMWSEHLPVQVLAYRLLKMLGSELLDQMYLDEASLAWAEKGIPNLNAPDTVDSNGTKLSQGDSVTLIKDLNVKGAGFTAKRGTMVKNISLTDDPKYIEGKVNGTHIVLVAAYLKKA